MKLKLLSTLLTCIACLTASHAYAQGTRYVDSVFANYTKTTVTYSTVYNQQMDIYQPTGDTATLRPILVLAHGGSFTSGDRNADNVITQLCADFAHKGYVTVSIDYRLTSAQNLLTADSAIIEVLRAVSDGKAAIRYFYQDAATTNTYKIDTNNLFVGGNSAGAVLYMHVAYITNVGMLSPTFQTLLTRVGGLDGNSGNPGYSTNVKGVINLAGALNVASWVQSCGKPVVSAQGDADPVVPYNCGNPEYGVVPVTLCGLGKMQPYITANTPYSASMVFPGDGHVPWQSNAAKFYRIDTMITSFLYKALSEPMNAVCTNTPLGILDDSYASRISLYPNPATNVLNISSSEMINNISLIDQTGRIVNQVSDIKTLHYQMNTSHLSAGVYIVRLNDVQGQTPVIRKIVIE